MGLWDWFLDALLSGGSAHSDSQGRSDARPQDRARQDEASVATLEKPVPKFDAVEWWKSEEATLVEPSPVTCPDLSHEGKALENVLLSHFDSHDLKMPPMPRVAQKVTQRISDPDFNIEKLGEELAEDQVIAAAVLRMVNSVLYSGRQRTTSLSQAASRLGVNAIRTLMVHQSLRAAAFESRGADQELSELVWNRSIASGCVMRILSQFTSLDKEEAFLVGLLHDLGNVIVLREVQKQEKMLRYKVDIETFEYICFECHQEFGELVADAWSLPPMLKDLICDHHTTPDADSPFVKERLQLQLSDMICALIGYAPFAPYDLMRSHPVQALGLADNPEFTDVLIELPGYVELHVASLSF